MDDEIQNQLDETYNAYLELYQQGRYEDALPYAIQCYELCQRDFGEQHPDTLNTLNNLAVLYQNIGDYTQAEPLYQQTLKISQDVLGNQHPDTAASLNNLALLYQAMGDYPRAKPLHQQALKIRQDVLGDQHPDTVNSLNSLAELYNAMGEYPRAEPLYQQALKIRQDVFGDQHPDTAASLNNLAVLYFTMSDYPRAEPLYQKALKIRENVLGDQHPDTATSLNNLAMLYFNMGDYTRAKPFLQQALKIFQDVLGDQNPDTASCLNNLAVLYQVMGDNPMADGKKVDDEIQNQLNKIYNTYLDLYQQGQYEDALPYATECYELCQRNFGDQHAETLASLNNLAILNSDIGDYPRAEPLFQLALKIKQDMLGDKHPETMTSLNSLAKLYSDMGDYNRAKPLYQQVLKIRQEVLGDQHPDTATSTNNLAGLYHAIGDYPRAEPLLQQALKIRQDLLGDQHPDTATSLNNLAGLYQAMGDYPRAEPLFQLALKIRQDVLGDQHPDIAASLNNLADLYHAMGDYTQAEPLLQQALKIRQDVLGDQHSDTATSINNLAALYRTMGDYPQAEPLYQQALNISKDVLGDQHPDTAASLNGLATLYHAMGDAPRAEPLYQQALTIRQNVFGDQHPITGASLNSLARLYQNIGDYTQAEPLCQQALKISKDVLGEQHSNTAACLNNLAELYKAMGDYPQAEPLYQQALDIWQDVLGDYHPNIATGLNNLAELTVALQQFDLALTLKMQACAIENSMIGQIFSFASESQRNTYLKTFQYTLSSLLSLTYSHLADNADAVSSALILVLQRKAVLAEALASQRDAILGGQYPELQGQFKTLSQLRMQIAQKTLTGPGKETTKIHRELLAQWNIEKEQLESELARHIPEMRLDEKLSSVNLQAVASKITECGTLIEFIRFDVFDFMAIPAKGESQWQPARYLAFIIPASDPDSVKIIDLGEAAMIDHEIAEFRSQITDPSNQRSFDQVDGSPSSVVVSEEPSRSNKTSLFSRWLIRKKVDQSRSHRDPDTVQPAPTTETHDQAGYKLYELLFKPLQEELGNNTRLLLSPDGDLTRLPFEVLPSSEGGRLINHYNISYLAVGRDLLRFGEKSGREPSAPIVLADPDFDLSEHASDATPQDKKPELDAIFTTTSTGRRSRDFEQANLHFGRLPGSRIEGERVGQLLGIKPWTDAAALERDLKNIRSPVILHLATHGFFLEDQKSDPNLDNSFHGGFINDADNTMQRFNVSGLENPLLRSGLALAGVNTWLSHGNTPEAAEDGLLTAEDVTSLNLLDTELVVLSACETGLGEVQVGEGVFGLRRSFILAGAKTLIMSLWKVPDHATAILMERLYKNLLEKRLPRDQALREAQDYLSQVTIGKIRKPWLNKRIIKKLAAGDLKTENVLKQLSNQPDDHQPFKHPFFWGAFICQGDPSPLPSFDFT